MAARELGWTSLARDPPPCEPSDPNMPALVLFLFGLALRLLFLSATPDGGGCWHIAFQGDAPVWQDLAGRAARGIYDVELVLPWRPPGMTWGIASLWDGEGATLWPVRTAFIVLGAMIAPMVWWLLRRRVGSDTAFLCALLCAASSNLMLLSSGLHAETPYLLLVLLSLFDFERLQRRATVLVALRWGCLHGALCLLRAEHTIVIAAFGLVLLLRRAPWWSLLLAMVGAAVPLVPWQLHANRLVTEFNAGEAQLPDSDILWNPEALARLRELPIFQQAPMFQFVSETMRVRGRRSVRVDDLAVIKDAFGVYPEPLQQRFLALQGGYSFWIASTPEAVSGYTTLPHDRPPPLLGGAEQYPRYVQTDRPQNGKFSLAYPPHLYAFIHGYQLGLAELTADPLGALQRMVGKVWYSLAGATGGLGGYAIPVGLSGERRPVDMVAATGIWPSIWRVLLLAVAGFGLWPLRREPVVIGLLAFAAARFVVIAGFYGHARHGALCMPLVLLGVSSAIVIAIGRFAKRDRNRMAIWLGAGLMVLLLSIELVRSSTVAVAIDGQPWRGSGGGAADHLPHTITFTAKPGG